MLGKGKKVSLGKLLLFLVGLFFSGLGVAVTRHGNLGVSPISSVANIMNLRFPFLQLGDWLIVWNCVLILGQVLILRKEFEWFQLLQIPLSFLFGWFTNFGMYITQWAESDSYPARILCVCVGTVILGFGIAIMVWADLIMNSGEAIVKAIAGKIKKEFGSVKICFDISCVILSVLLSLIMFQGKIEGTREGTVIAAVGTGFCVKLFSRCIRKFAKKE